VSPRRRRRERRRAEEAALLEIIERQDRRVANQRERERAEAETRARDEQVRAEVASGEQRAIELAARERARIGREGKRPRSKSKDLDKLLEIAWRAGLQIENGGSGHIKVQAESGKVISVPKTPSRQRTVKRIRSELRRCGLDV